MLYLVATPIGHLGDLTFRAVDVLKSCHYLLCEDTRHTLHLLHHYHISTRCISYHAFNEKEREEKVIEDLRQGLNIALVSDAGTPGICDPGTSLVKRCQEEHLPVTVIPGACAAISALVLSGCDTERFQFVGFLPKKEGALKELIAEISLYPGTTIAYETPHRLLESLEKLSSLLPDSHLSIVRELTKIHEECISGPPAKLALHFKETSPRGEIVLVFKGRFNSPFASLSPEEQIQSLQHTFNLSLSQAIKIVAKLSHIPKRILYNQHHQDEPQE